jgi:hypothetical protein
MALEDRLKEVFNQKSDSLLKYLKNKHKGGENNSKGNCFENYFAVFSIIKKFNEVGTEINPTFSCQLLCFIDDFVIETDARNSIEHFQLKDVQDLGWTDGKHSIADDFSMQYELIDYGKNKQLRLVVSSLGLRDKLADGIPENIKDKVEVKHFETANSIPRLIQANGLFNEELKKMCALSNPSLDKLEALATIVLGAWDATDKQQVPLSTLINNCYNQNPHYIRGLEKTLGNQRLNRILSSIQDFSFKVENGFVTWSYKNTDIGTVSFQIGSQGFMQWESDVINAEPATFENLETFLY